MEDKCKHINNYLKYDWWMYTYKKTEIERVDKNTTWLYIVYKNSLQTQ